MKIRKHVFRLKTLFILLAWVPLTVALAISAQALEGKTCAQCNASCLAFCQSIKLGDPVRYPRCLNDCANRMSACLSFSTYRSCIPNK